MELLRANQDAGFARDFKMDIINIKIVLFKQREPKGKSLYSDDKNKLKFNLILGLSY